MQYIKNMIDSLLNNWGVSHEIIIHLRLLILLVILILSAKVRLFGDSHENYGVKEKCVK